MVIQILEMFPRIKHTKPCFMQAPFPSLIVSFFFADFLTCFKSIDIYVRVASGRTMGMFLFFRSHFNLSIIFM